jgi:hypothetical protein
LWTPPLLLSRECESADHWAKAAGTDQLDPRADVDQDRSPRDEGAEDQIAQPLVLGHDFAQFLYRNLEDLSRVTNDSGEIETLAREQTQLT